MRAFLIIVFAICTLTAVVFALVINGALARVIATVLGVSATVAISAVGIVEAIDRVTEIWAETNQYRIKGSRRSG
jgi:hypothetical protein